MKEQNNMYELINEELNSIILNYILIKAIIDSLEVFEEVVSIIERSDKSV